MGGIPVALFLRREVAGVLVHWEAARAEETGQTCWLQGLVRAWCDAEARPTAICRHHRGQAPPDRRPLAQPCHLQ